MLHKCTAATSDVCALITQNPPSKFGRMHVCAYACLSNSPVALPVAMKNRRQAVLLAHTVAHVTSGAVSGTALPPLAVEDGVLAAAWVLVVAHAAASAVAPM